MPVRNEAGFIENAIESILRNKYPHDRLEIIVADGYSTDGTPEMVSRISARDARVRLIENPGKIVSTGLNLALRAIKGEVFIRIDGHAEIPDDFIANSVRCLQEHPEAWVAGGYWKTVSSGLVGRTISTATQSPIGVGNSMHRLGNFDGWVDTLAYGAHHKWVLDKVGYFDEQLVRNQDDDFNLRVHLAGGRIWMSSRIWSTYYARSSCKKLWRQYYQYGFWRIRTIQKHRTPASLRRLAPMLLVLSLIFLTVAGFAWSGFHWLLLVEVMVYCLGLLYGAVGVGRQEGLMSAVLAPVIFVILHFAYGLGCLWGIVRFVIFRGMGLPKPEQYSLSR